MNKKIPVTMVLGSDSGKTRFLNRLFDGSRADPEILGGIVVLASGSGKVVLAHRRVQHISESDFLHGVACTCCGGQGGAVAALRSLFMAALHRRIPPLFRVLIMASSPAQLDFIVAALRYDRFLGDRYRYDGAVVVFDGSRIAQAAASKSAPLADAFVVSKNGDLEPEALARMHKDLAGLSPHAKIYAMTDLPPVQTMFDSCSSRYALRRVHFVV